MNYQRFKNPFIILGIIVLVILAVGFLFRDKLNDIFIQYNVKISGYQAVFLANGQVYFGKISQIGSAYIVLKDIFYLQANNSLQAAGGNGSTSADQSQMSLVKLGNELHGPEDAMFINRGQILFFENLKPDSRVVSAIAEYQKNNATVAVPGNSAPAQ